jgi:hypothetical protein
MEVSNEISLDAVKYTDMVATLTPEGVPFTDFDLFMKEWMPLCMTGPTVFYSLLLVAEADLRQTLGLSPW